MWRKGSILISAGAVAVALAAAPAAGAAGQPAAAAPPAWVSVPAPASAASPAALVSVAATGPADAWAVGVEGVVPQTSWAYMLGTPLVLHWNGRAWAKVALPGVTWKGQLLSVSASSPDDVLAVGIDQADQTHVLRWNGRGWQPLPAPVDAAAPLLVRGIAAGPGGTAWLAGSDASGAVLEEWDGRAWQVVSTPVTSGAFNSVQVTASGVWVSGQSTDNDDYQAVILHRTGATWSEVTTESLAISNGQPFSPCCAAALQVDPLSPTDIWVSGTVDNRAVPYTASPLPWIGHWNGTEWDYSAVDLSTSWGSDNTISAGRSGQPQWIGASNEDGSSAAKYLHFDGTSWTSVSGPVLPGDPVAVMTSTASIPGTNATWSVSYTSPLGGPVIGYNPG